MRGEVMTYSAFPHVPECPVLRGSTSPCICREDAAVRSVPIYGFDACQVIATSAAQAKYAVFRAGKEAGYFSDFHAFLLDAGTPKRLRWEDQIDR